MSFTITKHADAPIIVNHIHADYNIATDIVPSNQQVRALLDQVIEPHYYIIVFGYVLTFEELMDGANRVARGENSLWHHPNIKQVIMVTDNDMLKLSAEGMQSHTFGNLVVPVFATLEDALAYTRG